MMNKNFVLRKWFCLVIIFIIIELRNLVGNNISYFLIYFIFYGDLIIAYV